MLELQTILYIYIFLQIVVVDMISDYWEIKKKVLSMIGLDENH